MRTWFSAAETIRGEGFRGLRHLASRPGDRFCAAVVLYTGEQQLSFGTGYGKPR